MFSDPKRAKAVKLPTTTCSLGSNDRIRSTLEHFHRTFVSKRNFQSSFVFSGESSRDKRKVFSGVFRHTWHNNAGQSHPGGYDEEGNELVAPGTDWYKDPSTNMDILLPRRFLDPNHFLSFNGVGVRTDEVRLNESYPSSALINYPDPVPPLPDSNVREFWAPYNMQMMETMSWNLNRYKVLPYGLEASQAQQWAFNGVSQFDTLRSGFRFIKGEYPTDTHYNASSNVDPVSYSVQSSHLTSLPVLTDLHYHQTGVSNVVKLLANINRRSPHPIRDNWSNTLDPTYSASSADVATAQASNVETYTHEDTPVNSVGKYHSQISSGIVYYTFSNTGDSKITVDLVVHKIKEDEALTYEDGTTITQRIVQHYGENWMDRRIRDKDQNFVDTSDIPDKKFSPMDVYLNPKVKFMPTSCRISKYPDVVGTAVGTDHSVAYSVPNEQSGTSYGMVSTKRIVDHGKSPAFIDIFRKQVVIPAGKRKTIAIRMPAKSYDPTKSLYSESPNGLEAGSIILNDHGYHLLFGVSGEKMRTIIDPTIQQQAAGAGPRVVGQHHSPSSFKVLGRYYETILPSVCINPDNNFEQNVSIETDVMPRFDDDAQDVDENFTGLRGFGEDIEKRIFSATYADKTQREVIGRYVRTLIDGQSTKRSMQQAEEFENNTTSDMETSGGYSDEASDPSDLPDNDDQDDASGNTVQYYNSVRETATIFYRQVTQATLDMPNPPSNDDERALCEHQGRNLMNSMNKAVTRFVSRLPKTFKLVKKWVGGAPKTLSNMKELMDWLCGLVQSHPSICKMAQAASGVPPGTIEGFCHAFNAAKLAAKGQLVAVAKEKYWPDPTTQPANGPTLAQIEAQQQLLLDNFDPFKYAGIMVPYKRQATDGTAISYIDEDQTTAGIQDIDDNVNVTNNLSVDLPAGQIAFTSVGLNKLAALKNSPLTQSEIGNIQYWSQQLYHDYETVANLTATNADPDTGHLRLLQLTYKVQSSVTLGSGVIFPNTGSSAITWLPGSGNTYNWFDLVRGVDWIVS